MVGKHPVVEIAAAVGGTIHEAVILPDGSGFATMTTALPKDHWLYAEHPDDPPAPMRVGVGVARDQLAQQIREATRYAVRATTMNGRVMDFDPDAMVQNMVVGLLGYWTKDGLSTDDGEHYPDL